MDIRQVRLFLKLCEHTSITQAAQSLHISQQALSSTISGLEEELGTRLFRRYHKGMALTDAGMYFHNLMAPVVEQFDGSLEAFVRRYSASSGDIRLALAPGILRSIAPDLLLRYAQSHPDVNVHIMETYDTECVEKVVGGEADLALTPETFSSYEVNYQNLRTEPLYAIMRRSHPLSRRKSVSMLDLKEEEFVSLDEKHRIYQCTLRACEAHGFKPNICQMSKDVGFLLSLVREKDYVFICVGHVLNELAHDYVPLPIQDPGMDWRIGGVFRKNEKPFAIVEDFFEFVKSVVDLRFINPT